MSDRQPDRDSLSSECYSSGSEPPPAQEGQMGELASQASPRTSRHPRRDRNTRSSSGGKLAPPARSTISKGATRANLSALRYCNASHKLRRGSRPKKAPRTNPALKLLSASSSSSSTTRRTARSAGGGGGAESSILPSARLMLKLGRRAYAPLDSAAGSGGGGGGFAFDTDVDLDPDTDTEDLIRGDAYASVLRAMLRQLRAERHDFERHVGSIENRMAGVKDEIDAISARQRERAAGGAAAAAAAAATGGAAAAAAVGTAAGGYHCPHEL